MARNISPNFLEHSQQRNGAELLGAIFYGKEYVVSFWGHVLWQGVKIHGKYVRQSFWEPW